MILLPDGERSLRLKSGEIVPIGRALRKQEPETLWRDYLSRGGKGSRSSYLLISGMAGGGLLKQLGALALQVGGLAGTEAPEGGGGHGDAGGGSGDGRGGDGGGDGDGDGEDGGGDNGGDGDEGEVGAKATKDGDGSPTRESTSVAQGLDFRRAGNMLVKAFGGGTAAAGGDGEESEEGGGLQRKWRKRRKVKRTAFDTNQRLAERWQAVAPNFAYA